MWASGPPRNGGNSGPKIAPMSLAKEFNGGCRARAQAYEGWTKATHNPYDDNGGCAKIAQKNLRRCWGSNYHHTAPYTTADLPPVSPDIYVAARVCAIWGYPHPVLYGLTSVAAYWMVVADQATYANDGCRYVWAFRHYGWPNYLERLGNYGCSCKKYEIPG